MGRLFWKILAGFWLALIAAAIGVGIGVALEQQARFDERMAQYEAAPLAAGRYTRARIDETTALLRHAGPEATARVLAERGPGDPRRPILVVDGDGRELLGREVSARMLAQARAEALALGNRDAGRDGGDGDDALRNAVGHVTLPDGSEYLVFAAPSRGDGPRRPGPWSPWLLIGAGLVASLAFAAGLAWYMARPIRLMRSAVRRVAGGDLDTRIGARLGTRRDELTELGRDFDAMTTQLQALIGAQQRLLHDVSHELRSPLARLQAAVGLAQQDPGRAGAMLERIERETRRLDELVGEVLALARAESGREAGARAPVDIDELLADVADDASFEAQPLGRSVRLSSAAPGARIVGHAELLHRAFDNVVRNALRHTAPASAVEISSGRRGDTIEIRIEDRGPGLAAGERERIFEPFARGSASDGDGFGLGLAIARRAIEAHGGRIEALDRDGGGLSVRIELPAMAEGGPERAGQPERRPGRP